MSICEYIWLKKAIYNLNRKDGFFYEFSLYFIMLFLTDKFSWQAENSLWLNNKCQLCTQILIVDDIGNKYAFKMGKNPRSNSPNWFNFFVNIFTFYF